MIGGNSVKSYIDAVETYKNFTIISKVKNNFFGKPINVYTVIYNDTNIYKSKNIDKCYKFCVFSINLAKSRTNKKIANIFKM